MKFNISKLSQNIILNFTGSGWQGLLTLIVTPFQVSFLGIKAYAVIGLLALLQVIINSLDFGLAATVTKLVAEDADNEKKSAAPLASLHILYWAIGFVIFLILIPCAGLIANIWTEDASSINPKTLENSIVLISIYLGIRYPVAFYSGVMNGMQWMGTQNCIKIVIQSLRLGGGVIVLVFSPTIEPLLGWYCLTSILEVSIYILILREKLPELFYFKKANVKSLRLQWRYSAGMYAVSLTGLLLGQLDRITVSNILTLEDFSVYSIIYNASIFISLIQLSVNTATFSTFSSVLSNRCKDATNLFSNYYLQANKLMAALVSFPCIALVFYSDEVLSLWINPEVADQGSLCLSILAIGFFLAAIVSNAYTAMTASSNQKFLLYINLAAISWYLPIMYILVKKYGIDGAAFSWLLLNLFYMFTMVPIVEEKISKQTYIVWIKSIFGMEFFSAILIVAISKMLKLALGMDSEIYFFCSLLFGALAYILILIRRFVLKGIA